MKKYIKSATVPEFRSSGAYLLDRSGNWITTILHVPSTTYINRGINHLCPTDAQFLLERKKIDAEEAEIILKYCVVEWLTNVENRDPSYVLSVLDTTKFTNYADLKYAPTLRSMFIKMAGKLKNHLSDEEFETFDALDDTWYEWLLNNYVKVSIIMNTAEFRINSNDGFDWNQVIIDKGILESGLSDNPSMRYNILRESDKGYKPYFINATLDEILENDSIILSSTYLDRRVINGNFVYVKK